MLVKLAGCLGHGIGTVLNTRVERARRHDDGTTTSGLTRRSPLPIQPDATEIWQIITAAIRAIDETTALFCAETSIVTMVKPTL